MELPDLVLVLIGLTLAVTVVVLAVANGRRDHALGDRIGEDYDRIPHEFGRKDRWR